MKPSHFYITFLTRNNRINDQLHFNRWVNSWIDSFMVEEYDGVLMLYSMDTMDACLYFPVNQINPEKLKTFKEIAINHAPIQHLDIPEHDLFTPFSLTRLFLDSEPDILVE